MPPEVAVAGWLLVVLLDTVVVVKLVMVAKAVVLLNSLDDWVE